MKLHCYCQLSLLTAGVTLFCVGVPSVWATSAATTTTLAITSAGVAVTSVTSGSVVTLTAAVSSRSAKITTGQVNFCDASVTFCTDTHLLGTAQLTGSGTASLTFRPRFGSQTYKAVFAGTKTDASSTSATAALAVTGGVVTTTQVEQTGSAGNYALTATVAGVGSAAPTGAVSFLNTSDGNAVLATSLTAANTPGAGFLNAGIVAGGGASVQTITSIALGDFNEDGILDLVAGNGSAAYSGGNTLTVLLGNGDGTFSPTSGSPATGGSSPAAIVVGDFNGDGKLDIAVANDNSNTVTVLLGNGDGTFSTNPTSVSTGLQPRSLVVGDFNGDGKLDIAVANFNSHTVTILLGNGDGTFTPTPASPEASSGPRSIVAGDFNGDGKLDLAVGGVTLTVLLGNGDGTFTPAAASSQPANGAQAIAIGDFNGDGKLDLALANGQTTVTLLLGNGDGTFSASTVDTGLDPGILNIIATIMAGDFNGDGHLDLAFFDYVGDDAGAIGAGVLLGKGDGTFTTPNANTGYLQLDALSPMPFVTGDLNGDGIPDLAVINGSPDTSEVSAVLAANETSTATATGVAVPPGSGTNQVIVSYPGDGNYQKSVSASTALTAAPGASSVTAAASPNPAPQATLVTLTATVTGQGATPTGTVTFGDSFGQLGIGTLNSAGVVIYSTSALTTGLYSITASYGGDANYSAATSAAITLTITAPVAGITIPAPPAVSPGESATATAAITAGSTYSGTLNLTCTLTASPTDAKSPPTCSLNPASVLLKAGGSGTSALTIATTAASPTASIVKPSRESSWGFGSGGAVLAVLLMCGIPARRRRWMPMLAIFWLSVAFAAIGCSTAPSGPTTIATTAGSYTFTVTGADSATAVATVSSTVTVTVR